MSRPFDQSTVTVRFIPWKTSTSVPGTAARCELNSHADTCVAGPNFQVDEYTGDHCDVTPYSTDYEPLKDIPIVNASTGFTNLTTGATTILRFNQVLWYGRKLQMSLINPNQLRYSGLSVSDDPTDKLVTLVSPVPISTSHSQCRAQQSSLILVSPRLGSMKTVES
jgi:hypothetical protein